MDIEKIKTLTELMVDNDLSEVIFREGEDRIILRRAGLPTEHHVTVPAAMYAPPPPPPVAHAPAAAPSVPSAPAAAPSADAGLDAIESPMVGTFYTASDPESPPFVKIGDRVTPDTVVCIIEAMKVFNEIKAEKKGTIVSIEVNNAAPVEFGQKLMKIRPD